MTDDDTNANGPEGADHESTRIISHSFQLDGMTFSWWAVDESPALVTVTSQWFGSKAELTDGDVEDFAKGLARRILVEQEEKAAEIRARLEEKEGR